MNPLLRPFHKLKKGAHAARMALLPREKIFTDIFQRNSWRDAESRSGTGSNLEATAAIRAALPGLIQKYDIKSMLDIPCGDLHWMSKVDLPLEQYIGADIVPDLIENIRTNHAAPNREFKHLDLVLDELPKVDCIFCRDCLVHLSFKDGLAAIANIKRSGATYLLTTTNVDRQHNRKIVTGMWRPLNLQAAPFHFPEPLELINENCTEANGSFADKSIGLWRVADL